MKRVFLIFIAVIQGITAMAQEAAQDQAVNYQHERMVYKQWDQNKFTPTSGFLGLNPLYWLTWGLRPQYKKVDRRPLSGSGPQTQRLGLTATYDDQANKSRLETDTIGDVARADIARTSSAFSGTEPLWFMYYKKELDFVINATPQDIINTVPPKILPQIIQASTFDWYMEQIGILRERLDGARTTDMDRGSRILAYHRILLKYRSLHEQWMDHLASAVLGLKQEQNRKIVKSAAAAVYSTARKSDKEIAKEVVNNDKGLGGH
ncbi:MAG: hypothetical protein EOP45_02905 [Sphingobacteriaceae bacterium]|nr:MAG: hypothetical protein EOP45_02905 [Sphingobacteriaceae bacterium]